MRTRFIVVTALVFSMAFLFGAAASMAQKNVQNSTAPAQFAQMNGGMTNSSGGGTNLPTLSGDKTAEFSAGSQSDAQNICDQVASQNGKKTCVANHGSSMNMWYCACM